MEFATELIHTLAGRQAPSTENAVPTPAEELLKLLQDPFARQLQVGSLWAALGTSFAITAGIALIFSFLRPYNTVVYAPKLKHADEQHAPPALGKGIFAWLGPLWTTTESDLIRLVGMDATMFMRFALMCRNLFLVLSVIGCAILIPVNHVYSQRFGNDSWISLSTPANVFGDAHWAQVVVAWAFDFTIAGFLWWNYRKVLQLRRQYFESPEYQNSLHARTLMLYDIPKKMASDEGIARIVDEVAPNSSFSRTAIARNVKILPQLISEHDKTVRKLEKVLAKYLKDPQNLPAARPVCAPSKKDRSYETYAKGQKVDAIEYLTQRIKELELEIKEVRMSVDKRNTMTYGFASYADISEAHAIAYAARKKKPQGATLRLAPRPNDIIWDNLPLSAPTRSRKRFINNLWIALLTLVWIGPNAMMAIFLVNLSNLGRVWPAFQQSLQANSGFWQVVQGVAAPALTAGVYLLLPSIFRRLAIKSGDQTKTGRERHVVGKLYSFFIFNNLVIFSLFSAIWAFVAGVVKRTNDGKQDSWQAIVDQEPGPTLLIALCNISPFFVTYILQRQLGTAIDLAQLWPLIWGFFVRKFSSPTPRELIELTAPPPFDYASYYNYFLYYATVALTFANIQPIILPAAAIYFAIDVPLRKYLLMYIFVTKTESGGVFWRVLFNRLIFATILSNIITFLIIFIRGNGNHFQAYAVAPLPFVMIAFKFYCSRTFDDKIHYYTTRNVQAGHPETGTGIANKEDLRNDRLAARFGHPVLYKPLITPMVHAKAQNILASVYSGRLTNGREAGSGDSASVSGYSDTYALGPMNAGQPGKVAGSGVSMPGFEVVPESRLDFEYYKNRTEFADDHGGGEMYGRPGTPSSMFGPDSRSASPAPGMASGRRQFSPQYGHDAGAGTAYQPGYNKPASPSPPSQSPYQGPSSPYSRAASPKPFSNIEPPSRTRSPMGLYGMGAGGNDSASDLVGNAAAMPMGTPLPRIPGQSMSRDHSLDRSGTPRAPGMLGGGPYGYGNLPQEEQEQDPMNYDYFRGGRRNPSGGPGPGGQGRG